MYPVQYLRNKTTTRVPGPGPIVKLVGTMVQDSVYKKIKKIINKQNKKERKAMYQRETNKSICY